MTEYEKLKHALTAAVSAERAYEEECHQFAQRLMNAFAEVLECPREKLGAIEADAPWPPPERWTTATAASVRAVLKWEKDSYFHFRIVLQLERGALAWPVRFKKVGGQFIVEIFPRNKALVARDPYLRHEVAPNLDGINEMFRYWIGHAVQMCEHGLSRFVEEKDIETGVRVLGFRHPTT